MALDEALLEDYAGRSSRQEVAAPTLRFYGWQPPCLSLGYAQRAEREVDFENCEKLGVDWVRRPTGGRAILHDWGELTYSLVALENDPQLRGGVLESYRVISGALLEGLKQLGVEAQLAGKDARGEQGASSAACFDTPSAYEVTFDNRKLIGSAQARRSGAILQQGTILLSVDVEKLFSVLKTPPRQTKAEAVEQVRSRLVSIEEALGQPVNFEQAEKAFIDGFAKYFQINFEETLPSPALLLTAQTLLESKYASPAWNMERQRPVPAFR